jgi:predicted O-methyltransferase YrrM
MDFIAKEIEEYALNHTKAESDLLKKINRETHAKIMMPRMLSGHLQGRFLSMISHMVKPDYILEIGTYTGYSALCLAEGLKENGKIITIDINEEIEKFVRNFFEQSLYKNKIDYRIGNALDIIPAIEYQLDMVFIDADKENYTAYYDLVFEKVKTGGYIIADNVLWSGKVLMDDNKLDKDTKAIKAFNDKIQNDSRVENILLPVRDGLMICRKK